MAKNWANEYVMAFPVSLMEILGNFQGLSFDVSKYLPIILEKNNFNFIRRGDAETNPQFKQLIPYAILSCDGSIFVYRRGKLLSEERLSGNYSIGIGGHVSVNDPNLFGSTYEEGLRREVNEEIDIQCSYSQRPVALINDDSSDVSRVHLGIVHIFTLSKPKVKAKEKSINETGFRTIADLKKGPDKFEDWSTICIDKIDALLEFKR